MRKLTFCASFLAISGVVAHAAPTFKNMTGEKASVTIEGNVVSVDVAVPAGGTAQAAAPKVQYFARWRVEMMRSPVGPCTGEALDPSKNQTVTLRFAQKDNSYACHVE